MRKQKKTENSLRGKCFQREKEYDIKQFNTLFPIYEKCKMISDHIIKTHRDYFDMVSVFVKNIKITTI